MKKVIKIEGQRLKTARKFIGITLAELSNRLNISIQQLNRIEQNKSNIFDVTLDKIIKELNKPRKIAGTNFRIQVSIPFSTNYFIN